MVIMLAGELRNTRYVRQMYFFTFAFLLTTFISIGFRPIIDLMNRFFLLGCWSLSIYFPLRNKNFGQELRYRLLIFFFLIYGAFVIFRNSYTVIDLKQAVLNYNNIYVYILTPYILSYGSLINNDTHGKVLFKLIKKIWWMVGLVLFFTYEEIGKSIENAMFFLVSFGFIYALFYENRKLWRWIFTLTFLILTFYISVEWGRRGRTVHMVLVFVATLFELLRSNQSAIIRHRRRFYLILGAVATFLVYWYADRIYALSRGFDSEAFEVSRGYVFENFFKSFKSKWDYIFGFGLNGKAYRGLEDAEYANNVENGWLTLLFQAGLIYTIPLLFLFLRASFFAFTSKLLIDRIMGYLIFIFLIDMFASDFAGMSPSYLFVLLAASSLLNRK
jgi:hypothetical protein